MRRGNATTQPKKATVNSSAKLPVKSTPKPVTDADADITNTTIDQLLDEVVPQIEPEESDTVLGNAVDDTAHIHVAEAQPAIAPDNTKEELAPPKKKPGRPKKKVVTEAIKINGVVDVPNDPEDKVEMVYQNPALFKNIFALFKAYDAKEIMIHFKSHTIEFAAQDHLQSTSISAIVDCSKLQHYYCGEPTRVFIRRNEIETILHNVRKVHARLTFILKTDYTTHIVVQTENSEVGNRNIYEVELCQINREIMDIFHAEDEYPLRFTLPAKHFKEEIGSIAQLSQRFTIEKNYGEPMSFSFENHKTKTIMNSPYMKPEKIKLVSRVPTDDIFAVSIKIEYIKPFANAKLGDNISIFVDTDKKIMFKTKLDDNVCTLRIYSSIIKIDA